MCVITIRSNSCYHRLKNGFVISKTCESGKSALTVLEIQATAMTHLQAPPQSMLNINRLQIYKVIFIPTSYQDAVYRDIGYPISKQGCRPFTDFLVPLVAVPLLVMFGLMLQSLMQTDWTLTASTRWRVLGLSVALLLVSLMVCAYITSRLGLCLCSYSEETGPDQFIRVGISQNKPHVCELPPSYEAATVELPPPPYSSVYLLDPSQLGASILHV